MHRLTVDEVCDGAKCYLDQKVCVEADLIVNGKEPYLVSVNRNADSLPKISLRSEELFERLISSVSCYVGGPFLYHDLVRACGRFVMDGPKYLLVDVNSFILIRNGDVYQIV